MKKTTTRFLGVFFKTQNKAEAYCKKHNNGLSEKDQRLKVFLKAEKGFIVFSIGQLIKAGWVISEGTC